MIVPPRTGAPCANAHWPGRTAERLTLEAVSSRLLREKLVMTASPWIAALVRAAAA